MTEVFNSGGSEELGVPVRDPVFPKWVYPSSKLSSIDCMFNLRRCMYVACLCLCYVCQWAWVPGTFTKETGTDEEVTKWVLLSMDGHALQTVSGQLCEATYLYTRVYSVGTELSKWSWHDFGWHCTITHWWCLLFTGNYPKALHTYAMWCNLL